MRLTDLQARVLYDAYFHGPTDEFAVASDLGPDADADECLAAILVCEQAGWLKRRPNRFHHEPDPGTGEERGTWMLDILTYERHQVEWHITGSGERFWEWAAPQYDPDHPDSRIAR